MASSSTRRRKHWGWGWEDQQPDRAALEQAAKAVHERLGFEVERIEEPVALESVALREARIEPPAALAGFVGGERHDRVSHALGKAYRDVVRGFRGDFENPPDLVARPSSEAEVEQVLAWCADEGLAAIPYGGGTSVVGGVEPRFGDEYPGVVTIDLGRLDRVLEVDEVSCAARIQAGALGPGLEDQLREYGMTLRHFPQSFEYSTLGGWIATRAGGHFATLYTHIDDLVESVRAITPAGEWESRRLPGSGAGPSPDRMLIGSEGTLGVITEAWVRVRPRPTAKLSCGVAFERFDAGAEAVREIAQSGLNPSNCRLLDVLEAETTGAGDGAHALLVLGFESARVAVSTPIDAAIEIARSHGGKPGEIRGTPDPRTGTVPASASAADSVSSWRGAFLAAPYLRDTLVACGVISDTFETAITWDRFPEFHATVSERVRAAVAEVTGAPREGAGAGRVSCRFTHVYPDGPAPYFTVLAPGRRGSEVAQWDEIKAAASDAVIAAGGTITHHHAVGRDHRPWYDRQRPDAFAAALRGAKRALDPAGILNPGVLIDP
ncbi:MAG: FAD-binding oxidoreductase [Solirubrobacterales bacterium]